MDGLKLKIEAQTPKGPHGQNRPADVIGNAVHVMRIATGEIEEAEINKKSSAGRLGGKKGGAARAQSMTPERRAEIAKKAAAKRWKTE